MLDVPSMEGLGRTVVCSQPKQVAQMDRGLYRRSSIQHHRTPSSTKRILSSYTVAGNKLSLKLQAVSPVGIPDLICDGTISGKLVDAQCLANAGGPPEKIVGSLAGK